MSFGTTMANESINSKLLQYTINETWDSQPVAANEQINIKFSKNTLDDSGGIILEVEAPFYSDPQLPEGTPVGSVNGLWDYEVVEVFLLSDSENKYLEVELAPTGHYLLLELDKQKKVLRNELPLKRYTVSVDGSRWKGSAVIPTDYIPPNVQRFNAYAIHKSDPNRVYMALFPVPSRKYESPSFHRLDYFKPIDLSQMY